MKNPLTIILIVVGLVFLTVGLSYGILTIAFIGGLLSVVTGLLKIPSNIHKTQQSFLGKIKSTLGILVKESLKPGEKILAYLQPASTITVNYLELIRRNRI
jgi:uncharacterized membrane protein HdeD (DUF308 family)